MQTILIFLFHWLFYAVQLLRFSVTCELWSSKPNWRLGFSLPSIIIMATANEPWNTETNKMNRNLPITTKRHDLLIRLKWASVSQEVRLDDWQQRKTQTISGGLNFRVRMLLKTAIKLIWFILSFQDKDFFEECKKEYLKKREDFQMNYVQSGKTADMKKKESVIA